MGVIAEFVSDRVELLPGTSAAMTLRLFNGGGECREVSLVVSGPLSDCVRFEAVVVVLDPDQVVDVPAAVVVPSTVEAGIYVVEVQATARSVGSVSDWADDGLGDGADDGSDDGLGDGLGDGVGGGLGDGLSAGAEVVVASGTVEVGVHCDYSVVLEPVVSRGARGGRHIVRVVNTGNVGVVLELSPDSVDGEGLSVVVEPSLLSVPPGLTGDAMVRVTPVATFWSGPDEDHVVAVRAVSDVGRTDVLVGAFRQRSKLPSWVGPAAAGAFAALLLGAIVWFAFARPWVQDTADEAAAEAIERDRVALRERIEELEVAAAEAEELPLGTPIDFGFQVEPTGGNAEMGAVAVESGTVVSITDVVFQNPTGAVGTVTLQRGDEVLLRSELANFRDFDLHFVAPYRFGDADEIVFSVECRTPGAGASTCPVGASLVGFVDEVD